MPPDTDDLAAFIGGFVAAEGCFSGSRDGRRFVFEVGLGAADRGMCDVLHAFLGVGHIYESSRRKVHYDDEVQFCVRSQRELIEAVIPFMDAHLPPSHKGQQYAQWRGRLLNYWRDRAKRRRSCGVAGCERCADIRDPATELYERPAD